MLEGPPDRLGEIRVGVADPGGDVVRYDAADECLAVSGTRDRHDIVAGVYARADDRGVSDAPLGLAGHPARGRGGGDATAGIAGHRADRPVAGGGRTAGPYLVQLLLARLGDEVVALDHLKSAALKERDVRVDDENVLSTLHHDAGDPDRVPGVLGCGDRTRKSGSSHHRCVELSVSRRGERGAAAGIEQRIVLKYF